MNGEVAPGRRDEGRGYASLGTGAITSDREGFDLGHAMFGLLLLVVLAASGSWFAWLYFVSPSCDQDRIRADQAGTGAQVVNVQRIGTRRDRAELNWVGGRATPRSGGMWLRIYNVTVSRPDGVLETYSVGVEARLFGLPELKRVDWRS